METQTLTLAREFYAVLTDWLSPGELAEVRQRNLSYAETACATHDFCDANMAMEAAFVKVTGDSPAFAPETDDPAYEAKLARMEAESALWNAAWAYAKSEWLTAQPGEPDDSRCGECAAVLSDEALVFCTANHPHHNHCVEFGFCTDAHARAYHARQH